MRLRIAAAIGWLGLLSAPVEAGITTVLNSRVTGFFGSQGVPDPDACAYRATSPANQPWQGNGGPVPNPPTGGAAVPGILGQNYRQQTWPFPAFYNAVDNAVPGARTVARTWIVAGCLPGATAVNHVYVSIPRNSILQQEVGALGACVLQLNYSVDFGVDGAGLDGAAVTAAYQTIGNLLLPGSYARFHAAGEYWQVDNVAGDNPVLLGTLLLDTGVITGFTGPFNVAPINTQPILGVAPNKVLRVTGMIRWEGDPMDITLQDMANQPCLTGDANEDGSLNGLDIPPFVTSLLNPDPELVHCNMDANEDGMLTILDVAPFAAALVSP